MSNAADRTQVTAKELSEYLGVTVRRVRQLAEEGVFVKRGRGLFDLPQAVNATIGVRLLTSDQKREADSLTLAAIGWLHHHSIVDRPINKKERPLWHNLCHRCGYGAEAEEAALANAARLLGRRAPRFTI